MEKDGTPCAVVNQLWSVLLHDCGKYFFIEKAANITIG
jgi:hypothetical protein